MEINTAIKYSDFRWSFNNYSDFAEAGILVDLIIALLCYSNNLIRNIKVQYKEFICVLIQL